MPHNGQIPEMRDALDRNQSSGPTGELDVHTGNPTCRRSGRPEQQRIEITARAFERLRQYAEAGGTELETGGILLGHETAGVSRIVVAGGPGPNAMRHPVAFRRDLDHARELADRAWEDQKAVWLGEWHTHPFAEPVPSDTDMNSYAAHLNDPDLHFARFISIIVGPIPVVAGELQWPPEHKAAATPSPEPSPEPRATATPDPDIALVTVAIAWVIDADGASVAPINFA